MMLLLNGLNQSSNLPGKSRSLELATNSPDCGEVSAARAISNNDGTNKETGTTEINAKQAATERQQIQRVQPKLTRKVMARFEAHDCTSHLLVGQPAVAAQFGEPDAGNKCGKCQNHEIEISKKGHARDCPFKKCSCSKCRLLDARSDILQVISGKETKLKGTKKDPNCGFCQNHGIKILRKGHVRSCSFGQERHFKLDNCFDCEVHYIRNEVNRLQIKMRRAMKEDRILSEEQRKTAREPITRDEVEKVCDMARLARKKRESILLSQQAGETSAQTIQSANLSPLSSSSSSSPSTASSATSLVSNGPQSCRSMVDQLRGQPAATHTRQLDQLVRQTGVWRPWSQHQVAAAMAAQQHQQQQHQQHQQHQQQQQQQQQHQQHLAQPAHFNQLHQVGAIKMEASNQDFCDARGQAAMNGFAPGQNMVNQEQLNMAAESNQQQQQQLNSAITSMAVVANQTYLINSLQVVQQQRMNAEAARDNQQLVGSMQLAPPPAPSPQSAGFNQISTTTDQPLPLTQRNMQVQQLFTNILRLMAEQYALRAQSNSNR